jgi:hypothetical protein
LAISSKKVLADVSRAIWVTWAARQVACHRTSEGPVGVVTPEEVSSTVSWTIRPSTDRINSMQPTFDG